MISILKTPSNIARFAYLVVLLGLPVFTMAQSQTSQVITVSPSLFTVTVDPGQPWQSTLRVVNSNNFDLVVYPQVMDFAPTGEGGTGHLMPQVDEAMAGQTLVDWIRVDTDPIRIPPQDSVSIPVTVIVPDDAIPGGHYAAIVVSSAPPATDRTAPTVLTTQMVTSLFFLTVDGDIVEQGSIREFRSDAQVFSRPEVDFSLRFENRGSVHIQPQGEITITNMWGQERGTIPVNTGTSFGNILPDSIREFNFTWSGEFSLYDIGRYEAKVGLVYGAKARQSVSASTYFWIIPLREIAFGILVYVGILIILGWSIKLYIKRILAQAMSSPTPPPTAVVVAEPPKTPTAQKQKQSFTWYGQMIRFFKRNQLLVTVVAMVLGAFMTWLLLADGLRTDTHYEVSIGGEVPVTLSAEDVQYQKLRSANPRTNPVQQSVPVAIINTSGKAGLGALAQVQLEDAGYEVSQVTTDVDSNNPRTVVLFAPSYAEEARELSALFANSLVSVVSEEAGAEEVLQVRIGSDYSGN